MRHATAVHHPHLASHWASMDALAYDSDADDEFRSPNGLDLDTSSEEDSPTNYSARPHAPSHDGFAPQYRVPGPNEPVSSSANSAQLYANERNAQDMESEYRLRVQMAYNRGDMAELEKTLIETKDMPALSQVRKLTKKAIKKLLAQRVLDEPLAFGAPLQNQAPPQGYPLAQADAPAPLKSPGQDSNIGLARKNDNTCVMDLLPGVVGWVIGRAGTRIKEIQGQSGCKMWVDQDVPDDQPRKLYFHGSKPNIDTAVQLVNDLLQSAPILAGKHGQVSRLTSHIMDCPPDLVGLLIGKKGWTIKKIQQESGAQISINQSVREGLPRKIIISGTEDAVHAAISLIEEVLKNKQDVPTRYVTVEDGVRTIPMPTTISAAGLANARTVPPGRVVATNAARPVYASDSLGNAVFQQPDAPARLNSAPPGFHVPVPVQQMGPAHGVQRSQTRSASPQLVTSPQHSVLVAHAQQQSMLGGYGDASTMAPSHAQQAINPAVAFQQQQQQQQQHAANMWQQQQHQQHQLHVMQMQQQQRHAQLQQKHQQQQPAPGTFPHSGYQHQLEQAVNGAVVQQQALQANGTPATYAAAAAAGAAPTSPVASTLERSMQALTVAEDAAVDSLLNAATVVSQADTATLASPSVAATIEEWQPTPPASAASPLWQPTSMLPTDGSNPTEAVPNLVTPAALPFDGLAAAAASDLPLVGSSILSAATAGVTTTTTADNATDQGPLVSMGLSSSTQSILLGSTAGSQAGWNAGAGQSF